MKRAVLFAVGISLGVGGAIAATRLLRKREPSGRARSPAALSAEARTVLDSVRSTLDAALAEWRRAMRETEIELRGQLSSP